jgi:hypothetical protein
MFPGLLESTLYVWPTCLELFKQHLTKYHQRSLQDLKPTIFSRLGNLLGRDRSYFVKHQSDSTKKLSETDIFNMLEFLIDNMQEISKSTKYCGFKIL